MSETLLCALFLSVIFISLFVILAVLIEILDELKDIRKLLSDDVLEELKSIRINSCRLR